MFTIYHIPAKQKIGITSRNPKIRVREQGYKDFEVLEITSDYQYAINREIELQKEYGYIVDRAKYDLNRLSMWGKINGAINGKKNYKHGNSKPKKGYTKEDARYYGTPSKPIKVFDKKGNLLGIFPSIKKAALSINVRHSYISNVLHGRVSTTKKYDFEYA